MRSMMFFVKFEEWTGEQEQMDDVCVIKFVYILFYKISAKG